jgi:hypothetical protein
MILGIYLSICKSAFSVTYVINMRGSLRDGTVRLPYDPATGELIQEVWERWLAWDPVRMVARHAEALRSMRAIYIEAGKRDQFFLDLGAEAFRRALAGLVLQMSSSNSLTQPTRALNIGTR